MYAKYGFSLMLIAFGTLAFGAGLLAPDAWRARVSGWVAPAAPASPAAVVKPAVVAARPATVPAAAPASANAVAPSTSVPAPGEAAAVPLENLEVPVPPPVKRSYALQAAQLAGAESANAMVTSIHERGLPAEPPIKTVDADGRVWYVVAIGPYATIDEAREARALAALRLQLQGALPAILLPAAPTP
jgi:cell division septation protein DedD